MGIGANNNYMNPALGGINPMNPLYAVSRNKNVQAKEVVQPSMVQAMLDRANTAYNNVNVPDLTTLFPYLSTTYQTPVYTPVQGMYGAGRYVGNTQNNTSGLLGPAFNFNAPTA